MNVFRETLRRIVERVEGAQAAAFVGSDGIPVETFSIGQTFSIETVAAEMLGLVKAAQNPRGESMAEPVRELAFVTDRSRVLLSRVSPEYYLLLLLGGGGGLGRGRYELAKAALALEKELV
ncbi:MAG TPA: roadblock/LC7 domain-containing protein [Thermoanaerobaculia bacterium]|nr:roadblock/LC7 domain-containing protein [Thermoanaerobaculia bacterium]